jgi:ribonuclease HI
MQFSEPASVGAHRTTHPAPHFCREPLSIAGRLPIAQTDRPRLDADRLAWEVGRNTIAQMEPGPSRTFAILAPAGERVTRYRLMQAPAPHFVLYTESSRCGGVSPRWKFVLQSLDGDERLSAADSESDSRSSRLELLAVVRGLEAIDRPARVTLLTRSRYVSRGIRRQLGQWRELGWRWERFGQLVPIRDYDLWQRIDRALMFHQVECCAWHVDDRASRSQQENSPVRANYGIPGSLFAAAMATLRRGILTPFSAIRRPAFTRAA